MPVGAGPGARPDSPSRSLSGCLLPYREDASGQRYLRLREVDPHMAKEHLSRQQLQRHMTVVNQQMMTAQRTAGNPSTHSIFPEILVRYCLAHNHHCSFFVSLRPTRRSSRHDAIAINSPARVISVPDIQNLQRCLMQSTDS